MYRGMIHFHSKYSYDSILSIKSIVNFAIKEKLNFLILTDHDTIEGSRELKKYIEKNNYPIEVILAAEYKTEFGDIIAINIEHEMQNMKFDLFLEEVRKQGGSLLFPHPYTGHREIEKIAQIVDLIEVFNSRCEKHLNYQAEELAKKYEKNIYFASDAHTMGCLKNAIIHIEKNGSLIQSLLTRRVKPQTLKKTYRYELLLSQFIKAYKTNDLNLFINLLIMTIVLALKFKLLRKII